MKLKFGLPCVAVYHATLEKKKYTNESHTQRATAYNIDSNAVLLELILASRWNKKILPRSSNTSIANVDEKLVTPAIGYTTRVKTLGTFGKYSCSTTSTCLDKPQSR